jgi:hypothetical protein
MSLEQKYEKIKFFGIFILSCLLIIFLIQFYLLVEKNSIYNLDIIFSKSERVGDINLKKVGIHENFYIAASKSGTKYYYVNCAGLSRIKPENLVYFGSEVEAEAKGYSLAQNCKKPKN